MNFLKNFIPQEYIEALGWTLLHSIWQAAVIALLVAILMIFLQRSSEIRYMVAAGAMPLILLFALATFFVTLKSGANQPQGIHNIPEELNVAGSGMPLSNFENGQIQSINNEPSFMTQFKLYFSSHFPLIITLWFLGMLVLTLRFLGGLAYVQRLKKYKVEEITSQWELKIKNISSKIGLNKSIRLFESAMVTVPMVVGYFKPVILLPIGAITGLSTSQVESILAHELAHIARKDYLVNIFQTVIEILFFYHPAIWWISSKVREERENCCDDIAVKVNENTLVYAKALTTLGEMHLKSPGLAMAVTGKSGILFKRIKRMLTKPTQHPTFSEGFITACALFVCIFCFSFVARASLSSTFYQPITSDAVEAAHSQDGEFNAIVLNLENAVGNDDNLIIVKNKKGKIVELYVNGRKIPRNEIKNYEQQIQESLAQQNEQKSIGNKYTARDEAALNKLVEELDEDRHTVDRNEKIERDRNDQKTIPGNKGNNGRSADEDRKYSFEHRSSTNNNLKKESKEVINNFVQKTLEISRLGMEIASLSMKMESLQNKISGSGKASKENEAEVKRLEKEVAALEAKSSRLEKEIEKAGEAMGQWSIDFSSSIMDSVIDGMKFDFHWDDDNDSDNDDSDINSEE
ncbi:MAG: M48 family metalloprotease [Bacteroidota bacterium]|nr:M48 family metalloprotease [Bacteroidota bacterium]